VFNIDFTEGYNNSLIRNSPAYYAYTTQKQCVIRMASGVDIRNKNTILDTNESYFTGGRLAKNWVLEGGNKKFDTFNKAYNNINFRSNPQDGFGMVPPPGITDATIDTKSEDGSLREATINFVCHNRRQLEILETLYMRPGYPILLEWGWDPYIIFNKSPESFTQLFEVKSNEFSVLDMFFKPSSTINGINEEISKYKAESGGNYDGFIGYCKNFSFKVREDGGYDCVTEIIAHGEILESLKSKSKSTTKLYSIHDTDTYSPNSSLDEKEITDEFSYYLKSIKANLDKAGDKAIIEFVGTNTEEVAFTHVGVFQDKVADAEISGNIPDLEQDSTDDQFLSDHERLLNVIRNVSNVKNEYSNDMFVYSGDQDGIVGSGIGQQLNYRLYYNPNNSEEIIPIHALNRVAEDYLLGLSQIKELIKEVAKIDDTELNLSTQDPDRNRQEGKKGELINLPEGIFLIHQDPGETSLDGIDEERFIGKPWIRTGFDSIYEGTILKEISVEDSDPEVSSGVKKKIFVRWDLICQILNRLITPQYKKDHALVELTYLNPHAPTYKSGKNKKKQEDNSYKFNSKVFNHYLQYAAPESKNIFSFDRSEESPITKLKDIPLAYANVNQTFIPNGSTVPILGLSFDTDICIMPHQLQNMRIDNSDGRGILHLTSFIDTQTSVTDIGSIYFNLDHLISTYENLILEEYKTTNSLGEERTKRRLKKEFSFHAFITTIWNDVNRACGGFYDFGVHVEHSRPNVARIIDFTFKGKPSDISEDRPLYKFVPQGLKSIARESNFQSKIDNDFASVISIAAQAPNDIHSLEAMSFKAFHKNIKNRFTSTSKSETGRGRAEKEIYDRYKQDLDEYHNVVRSLKFYINKMNKSNYESELITSGEGTTLYRKPISPDLAKTYASGLEEMRHSIEIRHGQFNENGEENRGPILEENMSEKDIQKILNGEYPVSEENDKRPLIGSYRSDTTHDRSAIIPITVSMTLDGISGMHPLQIFQMDPDQLPKGYQDPNIVFVVKKETNKITSGQDWTTDITGYLTFLNGNPNTDKNDNILEAPPPTSNKLNKVANTSVSNNVVLALDYFILEAGYTQEQAAGIVAGLMGESGKNLNPTIVNPTSGAYGVAQWLGGRMKNLKEFAATKGKPFSDFMVQLEFIALEMKPGNKYTDFSANYDVVKNSKSPQQSLAAMAIYERWGYPVSLYYANGKNYTNVYNIILNEINNGTSPDGSLKSRIGYLNTLLNYLASPDETSIK
jgi:hypothetical protein